MATNTPIGADSRVDGEGLGGSETILIADDECAIRDLISTWLSAAGYSVLIATDGQHAINVAATSHEPIDLYVFDVAMPRLNGYECHDVLIATGRHVPTLFITGGSSPVTHRRRDLLHVSKPFSRAMLLSAVRRCLDSAATGRVAK